MDSFHQDTGKRIKELERELYIMRTSLRWKIPNFFYKFYKKNVKRFIPRPIFKVMRPFFSFLNNIRKIDVSNIFEMETRLYHEIMSLDIRCVDKLNFPPVNRPEVSIIIPVYNKWKFSYNCLKSILETVERISYEVIIVDDASSDETAKMIKKTENVVYIRNQKNLGFVGSCNFGAKKARGKYLVFLNNDTRVKKNWLSALRDTFRDNDNIGLVGSKLIFPDGRLQEAGGIIWKNNNAWNFGRSMDPDSYEFNYLKDVDYCSGASIMVENRIFHQLGDFDPIYSPGYFEDTDLAFKIRQSGLRVVYQPQSELFHFEGISSGTSLGAGMKKYQVANTEKFFTKWSDVLGRENTADEKKLFLARDRSLKKKVVLFMEWSVPTFDRDAGSFVVLEYLKVLRDLGYKIIYWPHNLHKFEPYTGILQQMGIEVVYGNVSFEKFIKNNGKFIDISIVCRPMVAKDNLDLIKKFSRSKIIYYAHDLHYLREIREAQTEGNEEKIKHAAEMKKLEHSIIEKSDLALFFSDKEVEIVKKELPRSLVEVTSWIQEENVPQNFLEFEKRKGIIFLGGFLHRPNIDAVVWFYEKIYPKLKKQIPGIKITVIGSHAPENILELNEENFEILGFVEENDIASYFNRAKVFVAPLRFGAGFKGKIAKAMSFGLPVVTTSIGSEGIGLVHKETAYISDDAEGFAESIIKLCGDKEAWNKLSKNSFEHIRNNYSAENAKKKISQVFDNLNVN